MITKNFSKQIFCEPLVQIADKKKLAVLFTIIFVGINTIFFCGYSFLGKRVVMEICPTNDAVVKFSHKDFSKQFELKADEKVKIVFGIRDESIFSNLEINFKSKSDNQFSITQFYLLGTPKKKQINFLDFGDVYTITGGIFREIKNSDGDFLSISAEKDATIICDEDKFLQNVVLGRIENELSIFIPMALQSIDNKIVFFLGQVLATFVISAAIFIGIFIVNKFVFLFACIILFSFAMRLSIFSYESADMTNCLLPWFDFFKSHGGFFGLREPVGDYNYPYRTIIAFLTYLPFKPTYMIKFVSIIFDYLCAFFCSYMIFRQTKHLVYSAFSFAVILFSPTVLLNGSLWGQCDIIYTTFVVLAFYFLWRKRTVATFVSLGCAFAFKLQFMFVIPVFIILYFKEKRFSLWHFFLIPILTIVLSMPAIFFGASLKDMLLVYIKQTASYPQLTLNFPNLYALFPIEYLKFGYVGLFMAMTIFAALLFFSLSKHLAGTEFSFEEILDLAIFSIVVCCFFFPRMHERYMFMADVLAIWYALLFRKNYLRAVAINVASFFAYMPFLIEKAVMPMSYLAIMLAVVLVCDAKKIAQVFLWTEKQKTQ